MAMSCGCLNPRVAGHGCFGVLSCLIRKIRFPCLIHQIYIFFCNIARTYAQLLQGKLYAASMCLIAANTSPPVNVKCRIGLDDHDSYNKLFERSASAQMGFQRVKMSS
ncbi:uncharacterized protein LOC107003728 [Solanum pennellii]|uniref:Uncharacterized protein LOC107003728 n=1 Tax=Solanum pennellii TaxID=28526 RepID=A0ABM1FIX5_SOLPN|nr:uncharacterized protein LOC107003728 [Solanum pennellii]